MKIPADPAFHVGLALLLGVFGQVAARHIRVPGIVVLLGLGIATGPDGLDILRPDYLADGLSHLVGFAVAIILFEGGMALDLRAVWRQGRAIRRLVTLGALVTAIGAWLAVRLLLGWEGLPAMLFATLVVVTGPTVIQPLLRRIRVSPRVAAVLEGEAIFGDAIGATLAVVVLELFLGARSGSLSDGWLGLVERFGVGVSLGLLAAIGILVAVRFERAVPADLRNVWSLAILVGVYQLAESLRSESGILVAIVAGLVVGNAPGRPLRALMAFKEELTALLLGLLFVLLAADVRVEEIRSLGWAGFGVVAILMFAVRPLDVAISTAGTDLTLRERAFLAWLAPRGIVAAAVASHFAEVFAAEGIPRGPELRALVFLVIAATVLVQGLSGGWVARLLGVARGPRAGWAILGANGLGLALAERLGERQEVVVIDSSSERCQHARSLGLSVIEANALDESTLFEPEVESRRGFIAATPNEEVNFIFARRAHQLLKATELWVARRRHHQGIRPEMVGEIGARTLFGRETRLEVWSLRLDRGLASIVTIVADKDTEPVPDVESDDGAAPFLPLLLRRGDAIAPFSEDSRPRVGDRVEIALYAEAADEALAVLERAGWRAESGRLAMTAAPAI